MSRRLLISFLVGAVFFTVLPIYAPPVLLQTTDMPPFLLGLGTGVVAGTVLALVNGSARGSLLVLACAFVGACLFLFGYLIPRFGLDLGGPSVLAEPPPTWFSSYFSACTWPSRQASAWGWRRCPARW